MSHLAKILLCLVVLSIPTVGSASSYAVPAVSVQNVATAIRMTGATLAVSVAVKQLLKGVDFVMDPENNQARSKEKVDYCSHGGTPCVNTPEEAVKYAMQSNFAVHWKYPFKGCKLNPRQGNGTINCTFEKDGDIRTIAFFNFNTIIKSASYEEIAEQIIANAKNGDKEAIAYLQSVANQSKPKPATPTSPSKDEGKPDTKPANPPRKEPEKPEQKTCIKHFSNYKTCPSLRQHGFTFLTKTDALKDSGIIGSAPAKTDNYNRFCGKHGTHINYRPTKKTQNSRLPNFAGTISSCQCCEETPNGAKIVTRYKANSK